MRQDELETGSQGRVSGQMPVPQGLCRPQQGTPGQGRGEGRPAEGGASSRGLVSAIPQWGQAAGALGRGCSPSEDSSPSVDRVVPVMARQQAKPPLHVHLEFSAQWLPSSSPFRSGDSQPPSCGCVHNAGGCTWTTCFPRQTQTTGAFEKPGSRPRNHFPWRLRPLTALQHTPQP